jgi:nucleoside-diphosphate-sugar epimerase
VTHHDGEKGKALVLGFPSFFASAVIEALAHASQRDVVFLCPHRLIPSARIWAGHFRRLKKRVEILEGEPFHIDFGLSGDEWMSLRDGVEIVYHLFPPCASRDNVRKALLESLELCDCALRLKRLVLLSLFGGGPADPAAPLDLHAAPPEREEASPWSLHAAASEKILLARRSRLPWTIFRSGIPAPRTLTHMPGQTTNMIDRVLGALILLHCQVDIRTLKKISHRKMLLTPVETLADAAVRLAEADEAEGEILNLYYDDGFDINFIRQVIDSVVTNPRIVDRAFLTRCRKKGQNLLAQWCTDMTPSGLLRYATAERYEPCERTARILRDAGIHPPQIGEILVDAIKFNVNAIEESIRSLEAMDQVSDSLV